MKRSLPRDGQLLARILLGLAMLIALAGGFLAMRAIVYRYRPAACHRSEAIVFHRNQFSIVQVVSVCDGDATAVAWLEERYGTDKPQKFFEYEILPSWPAADTTPVLAWSTGTAFKISVRKVWVVRRMDNAVAGWHVEYAIGHIERPGGQ